MARGRPRKSDPDKVLDTALTLFWKQGYAATSMNDVARATGMAKPGLYATFGNKDALFETALRHYFARFETGAGAVFLASEQPIEIAIRTLLEAVADSLLQEDGSCGCFLVNTIVEAASADTSVAALGKELAGNRNRMIETRVRRAQDDGEISTETPPEQITQFLTAQMLAIGAMASEGRTAREIQGVIDMAVTALPCGDARALQTAAG